MTFIPSTPGAILTVDFLEFAMENAYDILYIHNGTTTDAEQIGNYSGNNSPGRVIASNEAGALTFHFKSDYSMNDAGWKARISTLELEGITAVSNATDKKHKEEIDNNAWYMLDGRRLKSKPTQKGIYIRNGKKIAIK